MSSNESLNVIVNNNNNNGSIVPSNNGHSIEKKSMNHGSCDNNKNYNNSSNHSHDSDDDSSSLGITMSQTKIIDKIYMIISILFNIIIFYSVFIKGIDNLISVHIFGCITWFILLSISCCYDDIITYFKLQTSRNKSNNTNNNNTIIPSCTVEYNEHILSLIGLLTYTVALVLIILSIQTTIADNKSSSIDFMNDNNSSSTIDFVKDSYEFVRHRISISTKRSCCMEQSSRSLFLLDQNITTTTTTTTTTKTDITSNLYNDKCVMYWYYIFGIIAQYHNIVNTYNEFFASNGNKRVTNQNNKMNINHWMIKMENTFIIPISFICMIMIQSSKTIKSYLSSKFVSLSQLNNDDHWVAMLINTILLIWIIHKMIQYSTYFFYQTQSMSSSSSLWTLPPYLMNTPLASVLQKSEWKEQETDILTKKEIQEKKSIKESEAEVPQNTWKIYGNVYDMTSYISYHPGGKEAIMLGANRGTNDCTALFQSYHPFNIHKAKSILSKYQINTSTETTDDNQETKPTSTSKKYIVGEEEKKSDDINDDNTNIHKVTYTIATDNSIDDKIPNRNDFLPSLYHENDIFYSIICQRVHDEMKQKYNFDMIRDSRAPVSRWIWYLFLSIGTIVSCYAHCKGSIIGSLLFGIFGDLLGALGHDGGHYAVSHTPWLNDVALWGMSIIVNPIIWQHQHTYGHHQFTNHDEFDPDLHHFDGVMTVNIKETNEDKKKAPYLVRVYTYMYVLLLFSASTIGLTFWGPIRFIIDRSQFGIVEWTDRKRWIRTIGLMIHWTIFTFILLILPFYVHETTSNAIASILVYYVVSGTLFGAVTHIGHLNDYSLNRPLIEENRKKRHIIAQNSWAAEQIEHTNNFAPQDIISFLLTAGLGLQIEHHLFPGINHCHLMKIQPIVKQICIEYNVSYKSYDTHYELLCDCLTYMTRCATQNLGYQ